MRSVSPVRQASGAGLRERPQRSLVPGGNRGKPAERRPTGLPKQRRRNRVPDRVPSHGVNLVTVTGQDPGGRPQVGEASPIAPGRDG